MGGGSSSSSEQRTDQSTNITETITTTLGDVGLTGEDAVNLASVVNQGVLAQTSALSDLVSPVLNTQAEIFKSLRVDDSGGVTFVGGESNDNFKLPNDIAGIPTEFYLAVAAGVAVWAITKKVA